MCWGAAGLEWGQKSVQTAEVCRIERFSPIVSNYTCVICGTLALALAFCFMIRIAPEVEACVIISILLQVN